MSVQTYSQTRTSCSQSAYCNDVNGTGCRLLMMTGMKFSCLKYTNRRRRWMHQIWESRAGDEYFKLCKILTEFLDKFRQYYRMNIKFGYIMDSVKDDLQVCYNSESALKQKRILLLLISLYCLLW